MARLNEKDHNADQAAYGNLNPETADVIKAVEKELEIAVLHGTRELKNIIKTGTNADKLRAIRLCFDAMRITGHTSVNIKDDRAKREQARRLKGLGSTESLVSTLRALPPEVRKELAGQLLKAPELEPAIEVPKLPERDPIEKL